MHKLRTLFFSLVITITISCQTSRSGIKSAGAIQDLQACMTGSFYSGEQAERDSSYFNISLHMYPIWEYKPGNWLYVEQAVATMQENPSPQRIYKLEQIDDKTFVSKVYSIINDDVCIGKWKDPGFFNAFDQTILSEREGCAVYLTRTGSNKYTGSTKPNQCKSTLRGASYAESSVMITKDQIESWDQGFDANGNQVWGAIKGGYIFRKK